MVKKSNFSIVSNSTITKKCKKPCDSSSSSSCCTEQCIDCCTSQYQRLNRFSSSITTSQLAPTWSLAVTTNDGTSEVYNRCGNVIYPPNGNDEDSIDGAYTGITGAVYFVGDTGELNDRGSDDYLVAASAYYYVNEFAYGPYEPGCDNDQVYGWYVNVLNGNLELFAPFENVPIVINRTYLLGLTGGAMTSQQKSQLKVLNKLYKLSKSAIKEIDGVPSQEGNIVEVCDCKGQRWLLFIDSASSQNGSALFCNYEFAVVATKLC